MRRSGRTELPPKKQKGCGVSKGKGVFYNKLFAFDGKVTKQGCFFCKPQSQTEATHVTL